MFPGVGEHYPGMAAELYRSEPEDDAGLFAEVASAGDRIELVLHLWNVTPAVGDGGLADCERLQELGLGSLLCLAQTCSRRRGGAPSLSLVVAANRIAAFTGDEEMEPAKAILLAACRVIPQEYPDLACVAVDVMPPPPRLGARGAPRGTPAGRAVSPGSGRDGAAGRQARRVALGAELRAPVSAARAGRRYGGHLGRWSAPDAGEWNQP
jgi:hypothetical protein